MSVCDDRETQANRIRRLRDPDHHSVPDRLHLIAVVRGQERAYVPAEARNQVGRLLVTVSLGEGREARDIGKEKGLA
jgi:hypothetical protein